MCVCVCVCDRHFPELKSVDTSLDARYDGFPDLAVNFSRSGRALRGTSSFPAHTTIQNDTFEPLPRLEKLRIRSIGQWQWESHLQVGGGGFVQLSSENFQWFALRCINSIAATIKQLDLNTGHLDIKKRETPPPLPGLSICDCTCPCASCSC